MHVNRNQIESELEAGADHRRPARASFTKRTDAQWLDDLAGRNGKDCQELAHGDLANYLFRVAASYLDMRRESVSALLMLSGTELTEMAQDFVQEMLEKLARNQFALMAKYSGTGRFTSWIAQVIRNEIAGELRRAAWQKRSIYDPADVLASVVDLSACPAQRAAAAQLGELLYSALEQLPTHYRTAVWDRLVEGDSAEDVGRRLGISANAVNLLVFRGKKKLRLYLEEAGVDAEILSTFIIQPTACSMMQGASFTRVVRHRGAE